MKLKKSAYFIILYENSLLSLGSTVKKKWVGLLHYASWPPLFDMSHSFLKNKHLSRHSKFLVILLLLQACIGHSSYESRFQIAPFCVAYRDIQKEKGFKWNLIYCCKLVGQVKLSSKFLHCSLVFSNWIWIYKYDLA